MEYNHGSGSSSYLEVPHAFNKRILYWAYTERTRNLGDEFRVYLSQGCLYYISGETEVQRINLLRLHDQ